ncbi:cytochrome P450 [Aspergillus californicus]
MHAVLCLAALLSAFCYYLIWLLVLSLHKRQRDSQLPVEPYFVSLLKVILLRRGWDPLQFIRSSKSLFYNARPVRFRILFHELYIVQGAVNIAAFFKQRSLSGFHVHQILLRNVFALPASAAETAQKDDSGDLSSPHPGSKGAVEPRNRVEFLTMSSLSRGLKGAGLASLSSKFKHNIMARLDQLDLTTDWSHWSDFAGIFHTQLAAASIDTLCGPFLVASNPGFMEDLWTVDKNVLTLFACLPRFFAPEVYRARDRLLAAIKAWHAWARDAFHPESIDSAGDDPYWGTEFFRQRQAIFGAMNGFDLNAMATEDLAFVWGYVFFSLPGAYHFNIIVPLGANCNSSNKATFSVNQNMVIVAYWCCIEVYRDPPLLEQVRKEAAACISPHTQSLAQDASVSFNMDKLTGQPTLQAVYAETLRLRIHAVITRYTSRADVHLGGWTIPKDRAVLTSTAAGHLDEDIWCQPHGDQHSRLPPVDEFYAGRFLQSFSSPSSPQEEPLRFSIPQVQGAWMPYGVGAHACSGRQFAKTSIILMLALMVTQFDVHVLATKEQLRMCTRNFGFGALSPKGPVGVRIRRRARV